MAAALRAAPVRAEFVPPPLRPISEIDRLPGRSKYERARLQHVRQSAWIILRVRRDLGYRDVARRLDELSELAVRDRRAIDPERADRHAMHRRFFRIMAVRSHAEAAAGQLHHLRTQR